MNPKTKKNHTKTSNVLSRRKILKLGSYVALYHLGKPFTHAAQRKIIQKRKGKELKKQKATLLTKRFVERRNKLTFMAKQPLHGILHKAQPATLEEVKAVKMLADQIGHAITVVAANPQANFHKGS